jgi:hypothetical protein
VRGVIGLLPGGQVAAGIAAIGRSDLQIIVIVDVATGACKVGMAIGQQETSGAVIENGGSPGDGIVATGAVGSGEGRAGFGVRGIVGLLPGGQVAAGVAAIGGSDLQVVVIVDVAICAGNVGVAIGQQEAGGAVIEFSTLPAIKAVAALAIGSRKDHWISFMRRIGGVLPIL